MIAQVHGFCVGAGHDIAGQCDIIIAADTAKFIHSEVRGLGVTWRHLTAYYAGPQWAKIMMFTGDPVSGVEAERIGLVAKSVPDDRLDEEVRALAARIALVPTETLALNKATINKAFEAMGLREYLEFGAAMDAIAHGTHSFKSFISLIQEEGLGAALEARDGPFQRDPQTLPRREPQLMGSPSAPVDYSVADGVAWVVLNTPENYNAMTAPMAEAIEESLESANDDDEVRVLVITGVGPVFSAGGDVKEDLPKFTATPYFLADRSPRAGGHRSFVFQLQNFEKPTIAALNGVAAGGGFSLALACDLRIASDEARLAPIFSRIGLAPDTGTSYLLPRLVGLAKALEISFTGDVIDAADGSPDRPRQPGGADGGLRPRDEGARPEDRRRASAGPEAHQAPALPRLRGRPRGRVRPGGLPPGDLPAVRRLPGRHRCLR